MSEVMPALLPPTPVVCTLAAGFVSVSENDPAIEDTWEKTASLASGPHHADNCFLGLCVAMTACLGPSCLPLLSLLEQ